MLAITGSAGCGKSTILRRLGIHLSRSGKLVFLTNSETMPHKNVVSDALRELPARCVLLFDNAEIALNAIAPIVEHCRQHDIHPVIVVAARSNEMYRRGVHLHNVIDIEEFSVPHLTRPEVLGVISVLETHGLLGRLQGMTDRQRFEEFEARNRAGKQILVAMREATKGKGFDTIIKDEFESLNDHGVKLIYLFVALATDVGYKLKQTQVLKASLKASSLSPPDTLHALRRSLRDIVIPDGPRKDQLSLRHRIIANHVLQVAASRTIVAEAYKGLLPVLIGEMKGASYRSRVAGLFRALLNHEYIIDRFGSDVQEARDIFDSVESRLRTESHFWLQYGLLELECGYLVLAENYLAQAESLNPNSDYIKNSLGHLYLKKAVRATSATEAWEYMRYGSEILERQMDDGDSPYSFHIYCSQRLAWMRKWLIDDDHRLVELELLQEFAERGLRRYPRNRMLRTVNDDLQREYLGLAVR